MDFVTSANKFSSLDSDSSDDTTRNVNHSHSKKHSQFRQHNSKNSDYSSWRDKNDNGWTNVTNKSKPRKQPIVVANNNDQRDGKSKQGKNPNYGNSGGKRYNEINSGSAKFTIINSINSFVSGTNIDVLAANIVKKINDETSHHAKGKILEMAVSNLWHEILNHPLVHPFFDATNVREGDGHTALHWVNWPNCFSKPIDGFERSLEDAEKTIDTLFKAGYSPTKKNRHNESVIQSLNVAINKEKLPASWHASMLKLYTFPPSNVVDVCLKNIGSKITPVNANTHRTLYCWGFMLNPELAIKQVIVPCLLLSQGMKNSSGFWEFVHNHVSMFRNMIEKGPDTTSTDYDDLQLAFTTWNSKNQMKKFNELLAQHSIGINIKALPDTVFSDPIAAIIGECNISTIQKPYMLKMFSNKETISLGLYCLSHSQLFDNEINNKLLNMLDTLITKDKFTLFAIIEKKKNISIRCAEDCRKIIMDVFMNKPYRNMSQYS